MLASLRNLIAGDLFRSVLIGSAAWLIGKAWDLQAQRLKLYGDIAVMLARADAQSPAVRAELARLQVAAPTPVARAAEAVRALPAGDPRWPAARGRLLIAMRRDTALWSWINPARWDLLDESELTR